MSARPLGFGIWGTGMIAEFHAKALAEIAGVPVDLPLPLIPSLETFASGHANLA